MIRESEIRGTKTAYVDLGADYLTPCSISTCPTLAEGLKTLAQFSGDRCEKPRPDTDAVPGSDCIPKPQSPG